MIEIRWCIYCEGDIETGCEHDCPDYNNDNEERKAECQKKEVN